MTLYAHFSDEAALLDAAAERWLREIHDALAPIRDAETDPISAITSWLVTLYQIKRARALDDPNLFEALNIALARRKPFVSTHTSVLIAHLADLFARAEDALGPSNAHERAVLVYQATAAFHHPTIIAQMAHEDKEGQLRDIILLLMTAMSVD